MKAETELLCAFVQKPESRRLIDQLTINDFTSRGNADIFEAIQRLKNADMRINVRSIHQTISESIECDYGALQAELMQFVGDYQEAFKSIELHRKKREIAKVMDGLNRAMTGDQITLQASLRSALAELSAISITAGDWKAKTAHDAAKEYSDDLRERIERDGLVGMHTGIPKLDDVTGGWIEPDLITVGARSSMGKSVFGVFTSIRAAKSGKRVLYFSTEMGAKQLASRMIAQLAPLSMTQVQWRMIDNKSSQADTAMAMISGGVQRLVNLPIYIDDQAMVTVDEIVRRATAHYHDVGCDLIVVDHMHDLKHNFDDTRKSLGYIAKELKNLAKSLHVPVIMLAQLNRTADAGAETFPKMKHLEGAGAIEQASDIVLLLHHPYYYDNNLPDIDYKILVEKQRNGSRGLMLNVGYHAETQQFFNDTIECGKWLSTYTYKA